jgi:hypothetical protein
VLCYHHRYLFVGILTLLWLIVADFTLILFGFIFMENFTYMFPINLFFSGLLYFIMFILFCLLAGWYSR